MIGILQYPHPLLRRVAEALPSSAFATPGLTRYAQAISNLMVTRGLGDMPPADVLAATHASLDDMQWRLIALRTASGVSVLCNPEIVEFDGERLEFEASYPFASVPCLVKGPRKLTVRYRRVDGTENEIECQPSGARAVWQGVAGLNGSLIIDRLTGGEVIRFVKRYQRKLIEERENLVSAVAN